METLFLLSMICLVLFMVLATYDGAYLHLWKFELFNRPESVFEHKTHTVRAILFPFIVWLLFIDVSQIGFYIGLALVGLDLIVLGLDAYSEEDSRTFMNGLPRWEYITHLFANSLHFSAIILIIAARLTIGDSGIFYSDNFLMYSSFETVQFIAINILPGAIVLGLLHFVLLFDFGKKVWNQNRMRITCC